MSLAEELTVFEMFEKLLHSRPERGLDMKDDVQQALETLRDAIEVRRPDGHFTPRFYREALATIEAALTRSLDWREYDAAHEAALKEREERIAELEETYAGCKRAREILAEEATAWTDRAERAEAEVERLREALREIVWGTRPSSEWRAIARAALERK